MKIPGNTILTYDHTEPNPTPGNPVNLSYIHSDVGSNPFTVRFGMLHENEDVVSENEYYSSPLDRNLAASLQFMRGMERLMKNI